MKIIRKLLIFNEHKMFLIRKNISCHYVLMYLVIHNKKITLIFHVFLYNDALFFSVLYCSISILCKKTVII